MMRRLLLVLIVSGIGIALGCREDSDPPPQYVGEFGEAGAPIPVFTGEVDKSVRVAAGRGDDEAIDEPGAGRRDDGGSEQYDDSTPEGLLDAWVAVRARGMPEDVTPFLVPDQAAALSDLNGAVLAALDAGKEMLEALEEKFPDDMEQFDELVKKLEPMKAAFSADELSYSDVVIDPDNENEATCIITHGDGEEEDAILRRIDGKWRFYQEYLASQEALDGLEAVAANMQSLADALDAIIDRVRDGEFRTPEEVEEAFVAVQTGGN